MSATTRDVRLAEQRAPLTLVQFEGGFESIAVEMRDRFRRLRVEVKKSAGVNARQCRARLPSLKACASAPRFQFD